MKFFLVDFLVLIYLLLNTSESVKLYRKVPKSADKTILVEYKCILDCNRRTQFCAMMYINEWDWWPAPAEDYRYFALRCTPTNQLHYHFDIYMTGGDGLFDNYYDPVLEVYHDCQEDRYVQRQDFTLPHVPIQGLSVGNCG